MGISLHNVRKTLEGYQAIKDISLEIEDGQFVTLLGATGSGKTSLMRLMAGIDFPTKGKILFDSVDVTHTAVQKRSVAMVYQQFINYPSLTLFENIASPLRVMKPRLSKQQIAERVAKYASLLSIDHLLDHYPQEVSGGQQQRTAIARALAKESKFIFLDEPLANLDYKLREELRGELKKLLQEQGGVVVYATPEPDDALSMATHVAYMEDGKVLQFGPVEEVYYNPAVVEVGAYFSYPSMNIIPARMKKGDATARLVASDQIALDVSDLVDRLPGEEYLLGIRAYDFATPQNDAIEVRFNARVTLTEELGSDTELHADHGEISLVALVDEIIHEEIGAPIELCFDPQKVYIFDKETHRLVAKTHVGFPVKT